MPVLLEIPVNGADDLIFDGKIEFAVCDRDDREYSLRVPADDVIKAWREWNADEPESAISLEAYIARDLFDLTPYMFCGEPTALEEATWERYEEALS